MYEKERKYIEQSHLQGLDYISKLEPQTSNEVIFIEHQNVNENLS